MMVLVTAVGCVYGSVACAHDDENDSVRYRTIRQAVKKLRAQQDKLAQQAQVAKNKHEMFSKNQVKERVQKNKVLVKRKVESKLDNLPVVQERRKVEREKANKKFIKMVFGLFNIS